MFRRFVVWVRGKKPQEQQRCNIEAYLRVIIHQNELLIAMAKSESQVITQAKSKLDEAKKALLGAISRNS